jgi:GntR family transcriptional regulator, transcriptional repressor for pyruvate dehydrogenase complex
LTSLAEAMATAQDDDAALLADWSYMSTIVEAAGNLVFQLIMNSVRELYLPNVAAFAPVVAGRDERIGHYRRAAAAIDARNATEAAETIAELAGAQERQMLSSR